jgi:hypothetical protein
MKMRAYVVEVIFDDGWKIQFEGNRYGPYGSKAQAVATANEWVVNGRSQGHDVILTMGQPEDGRSAPDGHASGGPAA